MSDPAAEFDGPWKEALDLDFQPFVELLFPNAGTAAGREEFVFVHGADLARRVEQYNHRPEDRYSGAGVTPLIVMLEDDADRLVRFRAAVTKLCAELVARPDAHVMLAEMGPHLHAAALVSLDHDLEPLGPNDPGDGLMVAKHFAALTPLCPVIVHTSNGNRGDMMIGELELAGWRYHRILPVGDDWIERDWYRVAKRGAKTSPRLIPAKASAAPRLHPAILSAALASVRNSIGATRFDDVTSGVPFARARFLHRTPHRPQT